jgi:hypothetical protein
MIGAKLELFLLLTAERDVADERHIHGLTADIDTVRGNFDGKERAVIYASSSLLFSLNAVIRDGCVIRLVLRGFRGLGHSLDRKWNGHLRCRLGSGSPYR